MSNVNSRVAAVARIGIGIALLMELATTAPVLLALTRPDILRAPYLGSAEPVAGWLAAGILGAWALAAVAFTMGAYTILAAVAITTALVVTLGLDQQLYSNHLYLMMLFVGLLTVARADRALSVDSWRRGKRVTSPQWPMLLIRGQVSLVYLFAALAKLNADFLSGTVLNSYLRTEGPLALPSSWRSFELMAGLSLLTIAMELLLAAGLWLPRWRRSTMTLGLGLHAGMILWMTVPYQLLVFAITMFSGYLAFLAPGRGSMTVVWDDSCGFCAGWVRWFGRLDWLLALRFMPLSALPQAGLGVTPDEAATAMHVVSGSSKRTGFRAVTRVLGVLPVSFLWAPLLDLPPIRSVGERAYRAVARRRTCNVIPGTSSAS
jgi:predicted DCC family thiol-disulfide oxidoreductase YuxK